MTMQGNGFQQFSRVKVTGSGIGMFTLKCTIKHLSVKTTLNNKDSNLKQQVYTKHHTAGLKQKFHWSVKPVLQNICIKEPCILRKNYKDIHFVVIIGTFYCSCTFEIVPDSQTYTCIMIAAYSQGHCWTSVQPQGSTSSVMAEYMLGLEYSMFIRLCEKAPSSTKVLFVRVQRTALCRNDISPKLTSLCSPSAPSNKLNFISLAP